MPTFAFWPAPGSWRPTIARWQRGVIVLSGLVCLATLVWQYGFLGSWRADRWSTVGTAAAGVGLAVELLLGLWRAPRIRDVLRRRLPSLVLIAVLALQFVVLRWEREWWLNRFEVGGIAQLYVVALQVWLVSALVVETARVNQRLARLRVHPGRMVLSLFSGLILVGTVALKLPQATNAGAQLSWLDSLFTATSAVCVTGLIVVDTATAFTPFGQGILLGLIQLGGLGIMAVTGFLAVSVGQLGLRERALLADLFNADVSAEVGRLLRDIVLVTVAVEAVGAVLLVGPMRDLGASSPWGAAVFHSVSAFCNAGFSVFSDSIVGGVGAVRLNLVLAGLIMVGSVGVPVLSATVLWMRLRARGLHVPPRLGMRIVWWGSALLWVGGALILLLDRGALGQLPWSSRALAAFFQSVSARTAGFNSVDIGALAPSSLLLLLVWMFIGGAPGSTAGGIKVTTFAVMLATVRSMMRGDDGVTLWRRTIARHSVREAISVAFIGGLAAALGLFVLVLVEPLPFLDLAFETISALCTTGLSTGITAELEPVGRLVLIVLMLVGRIGPLTLVLAVSAGRRVRVRYPTERVVVG